MARRKSARIRRMKRHHRRALRRAARAARRALRAKRRIAAEHARRKIEVRETTKKKEHILGV